MTTRVAIDAPPALVAGPNTLGPEILEPSRPAKDEMVAVVGGTEIHKSHVYDRLLQTNRKSARTYVDMLVSDAVIAQQARHHAISIDVAAIDALVEDEEQTLRAQVQLEWSSKMTFEDYLRRQFDMSLDEYQRFLRLELARQGYRSVVIRFLAMLEDRAEVRFIVTRDREQLDAVREKVVEGADFATLAMRHSEDDTRRDGGLMPPFGPTFRHPIAKVAFELKPGDLSEVFTFESGGVSRHCLVYCLRRMPGRDVRFAEVRGEIAAELEVRPLTPFEQKAFTLRWCQPNEPLDSGTLNSERTPR